ncbi:hypothetical protein E2C01_046284 [Portunus trituberculatus]|uniref:Uncharacterized protein n=1 Tax=Portunus trituberculatus TaxID=210409 RepID=A0A5B7G4U0_PORTR|nr:hypothetical protein [Portunus trituberculatus]
MNRSEEQHHCRQLSQSPKFSVKILLSLQLVMSLLLNKYSFI